MVTEALTLASTAIDTANASGTSLSDVFSMINQGANTGLDFVGVTHPIGQFAVKAAAIGVGVMALANELALRAPAVGKTIGAVIAVGMVLKLASVYVGESEIDPIHDPAIIETVEPVSDR